MKITFLHPPVNLSGGVRVVATHAEGLAARGHAVRHVSVTPPRAPLRRQIKSVLRGRGVIPRPSVRASHLDDTNVPHVILPTPTIAADQLPDADVVVATWWETAEWMAALPASKGAKVHLIQDYEMFDHLPQDRVDAVYRLPVHRVVVSDYIQRMLEQHHGATGVDLVPNAVDLDHFTAPPRAKSDTLCVGVVYTERPRKNLALAIAALEVVKARLPHLRAVVFGTQEIADFLPLPGWVVYHKDPPQRDIPGLYACADVWLFTSESEGFGLPLLEAMACRTPVLATDAGAAPDLVDGSNGELLPAEVTAFADALERFDALPDAVWRVYSQAAHQTAHRYTWDMAFDLMEQSLTRASAQSGPRR